MRKECCHERHENSVGQQQAYYIPRVHRGEEVFRHSGWQHTRRKVRAALQACGVSANRQNRFDACGASAYVEFNKDTRMFRVVGFFCGDRFCIPCSRARAARVRSAILQLCEGENLRFVTLTRRCDDSSLSECLDDLIASFGRLRRSQFWKDHVKGGVAIYEVKRGDGSKKWHVHIHILCTGAFMPQGGLSEAWKESSRGSWVVDIRLVADAETAVRYVTKYVTKGFDNSVTGSTDDLAECIDALRGRRLLTSFGDWFGRVGELEDGTVGGWELVAPLLVIIRRAGEADPFAAGVILALREQYKKGEPCDGPMTDGGGET